MKIKNNPSVLAEKSEALYFRRPLIPISMGITAGIALGACWPGYYRWAVAIALFLISVIIWLLARYRSALFASVLLCVIAGYLSIQPWLTENLPPWHVSRFVDQSRWQIDGCIVDQPIQRQGRWQFVLEATQLANAREKFVVNGRVKVTGRGLFPEVRSGDMVTLNGRLREIRNFSNPGGFDYERFMALRGIRARVYARNGSLRLVRPGTAMPWQGRVGVMRQRLAAQMDTALEGYTTSTVVLLKAIVLGDRVQISQELRQNFNRAGVGHVLAISGLHIGMVAVAAFAAALWLLSWIPAMLDRAWTRKGAALFSLLPVFVYGVLAGLAPSTQRAIAMVMLLLMGYWVGRRHDWLNTLALAAVTIIVIHPPSLMNISFQLSFAAVLAIIMGMDAFPLGKTSPKSVPWQRWARRLGASGWVSILAILGTLPLVLYYFNQVSLVGVATNLVVVPIVGVVVVPGGLLGVFSSIFSVDLAAFCWKVAAMGLELVRIIVEQVAQWPLAAVKTITPSVPEMVLFYLLGALLLHWKRLPWPAAALMTVLTLCGVDTIYWTYQRFGRQDLRVTAVDVGQGSANLLQLPGGYTVLLDGGGFSDNSAFDVGAYILAPFLWRQKIKTIDLVILTHPNSDHLNGLLFILKHFNVQEVWSNHEPASTSGFRQWDRLLADRQLKHPEFDQMPMQVVRCGVQLEILNPPLDFMQRRRTESWRDSNNNSLVVRASYGKLSILFAGDISNRAEDELVTRFGPSGLQSTLLMVPHHGSRKSCTVRFLNAVQPTEAVISAGWQNRFGFPHEIVLKRLADNGCRVWCTHTQGAVQVITDGRSYRIRSSRPTNSESHKILP